MRIALGFHKSNTERAHALLGTLCNEEVSEPRSEAVESVRSRFFGRQFMFAGVKDEREARKLLLRSAVFSFGIAVLLSFISGLLVFSVVPIAFGIVTLRLQRMAFARAQIFERDYTALLLSLASAVRTGMDPMAALIHCKSLFPPSSLVAAELDELKQLIEKGVREEEAIEAFGSSICHPDLPLFRTAFILARREGSSLSVCLQRLAKVTRQRQSFRRKVKSAVAMQRLSALGIGACAIAIGCIQFTSNPEAMMKTLDHPTGSKLLMLGVFLMLLGISWMMRLARSRL